MTLIKPSSPRSTRLEHREQAPWSAPARWAARASPSPAWPGLHGHERLLHQPRRRRIDSHPPPTLTWGHLPGHSRGLRPFTNEILVGKAIAGRRDEVQLATKFATEFDDNGTSHGTNGKPGTRTPRYRAVPATPRHRPGRPVLPAPRRPERTDRGHRRRHAEMVTAGKVRYLGLSEAAATTIRRAHAEHPITACSRSTHCSPAARSTTTC